MEDVKVKFNIRDAGFRIIFSLIIMEDHCIYTNFHFKEIGSWINRPNGYLLNSTKISDQYIDIYHIEE